MKQRLFLILMLLPWMASSLLAAEEEPQVIDYIRIIVNDRIATNNEVLDQVATLRQQIMQSMPPGPARALQIKTLEEKVVQNLVHDFLLLDRAKQLKIEVTDEEIESRIDDLEEKDPRILQVYGRSELREQISNDMTRQRVIGQEVDSKIHVSQEEVLQFCEENDGKRRKLGVAQILFRNRQEPPPELVTSIQESVINGESFETLARRYSGDPQAKDTGGKLGFFEKGQLLPAIDEAAFALELGQVSQLVETEFGYHLIHVYDEQEVAGVNCATLPAATQRQYSDRLYGQKKQQVFAEYIEGLKRSAQLQVR